jgi:hypothetical protein
MNPPSWLVGANEHGRPTTYGRRTSQAADERTGEAGDAAAAVLPSQQAIEAAARALVR